MATIRRYSLRTPAKDKDEGEALGGLHFQVGLSSERGAQAIATSGALRLHPLSYIAWDACIVGEERTDLTRPAHSASL